jgi:GWxTD domain-containing protein
MRKAIIAAILAALVPVTAFAQAEFDLVADVVQFRVDEKRVMWEFHYAFPDTSLRYVPSNGAFIGELYIRLSLSNTLGDTIRQEWIASATAATARPAHQRFLSGIRTLVIDAGQYTVDLVAYDVQDTTFGIKTSFTTVANPFASDVAMSEIMFTLPGTDVTPAIDPRFVRNGLAALPNPRHEFVGTDPSIGVYAEVYNTKAKGLGEFVVQYEVLDNVRREAMMMNLDRKALADGMVERVDIPAGALPSGVYYLRMSVKSKDLTKTHAVREERFFIMNPDLPPEQPTLMTEDERFERSEWSTHTGDRLELELELSDILATPSEKLTRAGCTSERAKQKYLFRFWEVRDPDQTTQINERLDEFRTCYSRAQAYYASPAFPNGWKSDRGKALLKYGIPTQIEQHFQQLDKRPYEVWFYRAIQGGVFFYFVDRWMDGNHRLVHSTLMGEIRDEKWEERYVNVFSPDPDRNRKSRDDVR